MCVDGRFSKIRSHMLYVMHNKIPFYLQFFCVVIAAYTTEITYPRTGSAYAAHFVCYHNPKADKSGFRICLSLMGVAISSILVCMVLMIFDVFIPCVNTKVMII